MKLARLRQNKCTNTGLVVVVVKSLKETCFVNVGNQVDFGHVQQNEPTLEGLGITRAIMKLNIDDMYCVIKVLVYDLDIILK